MTFLVKIFLKLKLFFINLTFHKRFPLLFPPKKKISPLKKKRFPKNKSFGLFSNQKPKTKFKFSNWISSWNIKHFFLPEEPIVHTKPFFTVRWKIRNLITWSHTYKPPTHQYCVYMWAFTVPILWIGNWEKEQVLHWKKRRKGRNMNWI